jgi:hypothetical protein
MARISSKRKAAALVTTALALTAIVAPSAGALPDKGVQGSTGAQSAGAVGRFVPEGPDAGVYCGKDYSQNSVTGDYCVRLKATPSLPPIAAKHDGFSWGDAEAGAGAALALLVAAAGSTTVLRRRRAVAAASRRRAPSTT